VPGAPSLSRLDPVAVRALLPPWLASTVTPAFGPAVHAAMVELLQRTTDAELEQALLAMAALGEEHRLYPAVPFARRLSRAYMAPLLLPGSQVHGVEHLVQALALGPTLLLGNHRSYVDTQLTDLLLSRRDPNLAARLVTVAGPKVYADTFRRIAALGLSTLHTAQSATVASAAAVMSVREIARIAGQTVVQAHALMSAGHAVLLYPEGTRSRDGQLGPFLRGAGRYARLDDVQVVPVALSGSERVFPIDVPTLSPAVVHLRLGLPFAAAGLDRDAVLERARAEIEALLSLQPTSTDHR